MKTKKMFRMIALIACMAIANLLPEAQAATRYVKLDGAATKTGVDWANASGNIQAMIDEVFEADGGEVWIAGGTYKLAATLQMKEGVNIYGGFAGDETSIDDRQIIEDGYSWDFAHATVLDGQNARRVLYQPVAFTVETVFDGLTITKGNSYHSNDASSGSGAYIRTNGKLSNSIVIKNEYDGYPYVSYGAVFGGGVYNYGGTVSHCLVTENKISSDAYHFALEIQGGGIFNNGGGIIEDCHVTDNVAENGSTSASGGSDVSGGGIYNGNGTIKRCRDVSGNKVIARSANTRAYGGGIACSSTTYSIVTDCIIENNQIMYDRGEGGGVYRGFVTRSIIQGNIAGKGGGLCKSIATNCLMIGNKATAATNGDGGGAFSGETINCTVVRNSASNGKGGAICGESQTNRAIATNCIAWGNSSKNTIGDGQCFDTNLTYSAAENLLHCPDFPPSHWCNNYNIPLESGNTEGWGTYLAPLFVDPGTNDFRTSSYRLQPESPCIGMGDISVYKQYNMDSDLSWFPRFYGRRIDMGAYELQKTWIIDVIGCMDPTALNYHPMATMHSDACIYELEPEEELCGCDDPAALNYNPLVTKYDASCLYADEKNTYIEPEEEETLGTVGTNPLEDCQLDAELIISLAKIMGVTISDEERVIVEWVVEQWNDGNLNSYTYLVDYFLDNFDESGAYLFYLSIICNSGILRAGNDVTGYTVSATGYVNLNTGIRTPQSESNRMTIYPNPVKEQLEIRNYQLGIEDKIEIIDLSGRKVQVLAASFQNGTASIDVSALPAGIYVLKIGNSHGKFVKID